jgi:hypothetical protein
VAGRVASASVAGPVQKYFSGVGWGEGDFATSIG